jgi:hypothetical protein
MAATRTTMATVPESSWNNANNTNTNSNNNNNNNNSVATGVGGGGTSSGGGSSGTAAIFSFVSGGGGNNNKPDTSAAAAAAAAATASARGGGPSHGLGPVDSLQHREKSTRERCIDYVSSLPRPKTKTRGNQNRPRRIGPCTVEPQRLGMPDQRHRHPTRFVDEWMIP